MSTENKTTKRQKQLARMVDLECYVRDNCGSATSVAQIRFLLRRQGDELQPKLQAISWFLAACHVVSPLPDEVRVEDFLEDGQPWVIRNDSGSFNSIASLRRQLLEAAPDLVIKPVFMIGASMPAKTFEIFDCAWDRSVGQIVDVADEKMGVCVSPPGTDISEVAKIAEALVRSRSGWDVVRVVFNGRPLDVYRKHGAEGAKLALRDYWSKCSQERS